MEKNILEIIHDNANSIEISKTTKGYTYSVKGYGNDFNEILKRIEQIIERLRCQNQKGRGSGKSIASYRSR